MVQEDVADQLHLFVCCHGARDARCGRIGPELCRAFEERVAQLGLQERVHVLMCSHIGGHKVRASPAVRSVPDLVTTWPAEDACKAADTVQLGQCLPGGAALRCLLS